MGENICKWCNQQKVDIQNIQTSHNNQYIKKKQQQQQQMGQKT